MKTETEIRERISNLKELLIEKPIMNEILTSAINTLEWVLRVEEHTPQLTCDGRCMDPYNPDPQDHHPRCNYGNWLKGSRLHRLHSYVAPRVEAAWKAALRETLSVCGAAPYREETVHNAWLACNPQEH